MTTPAPQPLLAFLLLTASVLAEGSDGDSPSCTRDPLTVPRGQPAVMSCTVSTPLSQVAIRLSTPGKASQLIFRVDGPGHFSNSGWQLEVRGGEARLVIPDAQPAQAGEYTWLLVGTHRSVGHTSLIVSEPLVTEATSTPPTGTRVPLPVSTVSPTPVLLAITVPILLVIIVSVLGFAWFRRPHSWIMRRIRQVFPRQNPGPEPGGEQGHLAPGLQPLEPCPTRNRNRRHQCQPSGPHPRSPTPDVSPAP